MTYQSAVTALLAAGDNNSLVEEVNSLVQTAMDAQGLEDTTEVHRFMLYHTSPMDVRISGMMRHLAAKYAKPVVSKVQPDLVDTGISAGWRSVDNSTKQINHLLIGLPYMYAILITTVTDKIKNTKRIHSVVGTFTNSNFRSMGTNPSAKTETVSSHKETSRLLGYLDKLTKEEPIKPIVKDEKKTMSYANKQYKARWVKSNGSLPHPSTQTPGP